MKKLHYQANNFYTKLVVGCSGLLFPDGLLVACITIPDVSTALLTPEISGIMFKHLGHMRSELNMLYKFVL